MAQQNVVLIGPAPGRGAVPGAPAFGSEGQSAGARLARLVGVPDVSAYCRTRNLLPTWPGTGPGGGDRLDAAALAAAARANPLGYEVAVFVGRAVAVAYGYGRLPPLATWTTDGPALVALLPHPSGRNRWWNDPAHTAAARRWLRGLLGLPSAG